MLRLMTLLSAMASAISGLVLLSAMPAGAQTSDPSSAGSQVTALSVRSNLVLVPALVKTKSGELVFELTADDFRRLDKVSAPVLLYPYWHQAKTARDRLSPADLTLLRPHL